MKVNAVGFTGVPGNWEDFRAENGGGDVFMVLNIPNKQGETHLEQEVRISTADPWTMQVWTVRVHLQADFL